MNKVKVSEKIEKEIISLFSKDSFFEYLTKYNIREVKGRNYSDIVKDACRYGIMYMFYAISLKDRELLKYVRVVEGRCHGIWHCYLMVGDYYVDVTIAQFNSNYPEVLVIKKEKAEDYSLRVTNIYTVKEWFEWEENN